MKQILPKSKMCFCCGTDNPIGLHLNYYFESDKVSVNFKLNETYGVSQHSVHLGIVFGILSEAMTWVPVYILGYPTVMVDFNSKIFKPIPTNKTLYIVAEAISANHWISEVQGFLKDEEENIYVKAFGKLIVKKIDDKIVNEHFAKFHACK